MYCLLHNILHSYCTLTARCTAHLLQATFLRAMDWKGVHELLIDAAVLKKTSTGGAAVQVERMMAMLALTAVHDIMKCEVLLPTALRVDLCTYIGPTGLAFRLITSVIYHFRCCCLPCCPSTLPSAALRRAM